MHRAAPVQNKLCAQRVAEKNYEKHKAKMKSMKSSIDNSPPKEFSHLKTNRKKIQLETEKYEKIRKENQLLLTKMTDIMRHDTFDSKNDSLKYVRSLNVDYRRKELLKITEENLALLKRIQEKQPTYNSLKWIQERKQNELYCKNICQYNYVLTDSSSPDLNRKSMSKSPLSKQKADQDKAEEEEINRLLEESARLREELTKQQEELQQDQALLQQVEDLEKLQQQQEQPQSQSQEAAPQ